MEEMLVSYGKGVVESSLGKLGSSLLNEALLVGSVREDILFIRDELQSMNAVMNDMIRAGSLNDQDKVWMLHVLQVACDAELCMDKFDGCRSKHREPGVIGASLRAGNFVYTIYPRYLVAKKIQNLKAQAMEVSQRHSRYNIAIPTKVMTNTIELARRASMGRPDGLDFSHLMPEDAIAGNNSFKELREKLKGDSFKVIAIVGPAGSGKTALAKMAYRRRNDCDIGNYDKSAWITLPEKPDKNKVLEGILRQVGDSCKGTERFQGDKLTNELTEKLKIQLEGKSYLIVLDSAKTEEDLKAIDEVVSLMQTQQNPGVGNQHSQPQGKNPEGELATTPNPSEGGLTAIANPSEGDLTATANPSEGELAPTTNLSEGELAPTANPSEGGLAATANPSDGELTATANPSQGDLATTTNPSEGVLVAISNPSDGGLTATANLSEAGGLATATNPSDDGLAAPANPSEVELAATANPSEGELTATDNPSEGKQLKRTILLTFREQDDVAVSCDTEKVIIKPEETVNSKLCRQMLLSTWWDTTLTLSWSSTITSPWVKTILTLLLNIASTLWATLLKLFNWIAKFYKRHNNGLTLLFFLLIMIVLAIMAFRIIVQLIFYPIPTIIAIGKIILIGPFAILIIVEVPKWLYKHSSDLIQRGQYFHLTSVKGVPVNRVLTFIKLCDEQASVFGSVPSAVKFICGALVAKNLDSRTKESLFKNLSSLYDKTKESAQEEAKKRAQEDDQQGAAKKAEPAKEAQAGDAVEAPLSAAKEAQKGDVVEAPLSAAKEAQKGDVVEAPLSVAEEAQKGDAVEALLSAAEEAQPGDAVEAPLSAAEEAQPGDAVEAPLSAAEEAQKGDAVEVPVKAAEKAPVKAVEKAPVNAAEKSKKGDVATRTAKQLKEELEGVIECCYNILSASHNPALQNCANDLIILPEGYAINRKRLMRRWINLNLVSAAPSLTIEQVAESCFNELLVRGFIDVESINPCGKVKFCRINSMFKEYLMKNCNQTSPPDKNSFQLYDIQPFRTPESFKIISNYSSGISMKYSSLMNTLNKRWRSHNKSQMDSATELDSDSLKIFDLEGCRDLTKEHFRFLPMCINLKFVSLRNTNLKEIPKEIGQLHTLEALDVRQTQIRDIPKDILHLSRLKNIWAGSISKPESSEDGLEFSTVSIKVPEGMEEMSSLQTLAYVEATRPLLLGLREWTQLKRLGLVIRDKKLNSKPLCISLMMLRASLLSLSIIDERANNSLDFLEYLCFPPLNLKSLTLKGYLESLPQWIGDHKRLTKLIIADTRLRSDAMRLIGKIPTLLCLKLYNNSFQEVVLTLEKNEFPVLKVLIIHCDYIQKVIFQKGATPRLEVIRWVLPKSIIKESEGISDLPMLKEISLIGDVDLQAQKSIIDDVKKHANYGTTLVFEKIEKIEKTKTPEGGKKQDVGNASKEGKKQDAGNAPKGGKIQDAGNATDEGRRPEAPEGDRRAQSPDGELRPEAPEGDRRAQSPDRELRPEVTKGGGDLGSSNLKHRKKSHNLLRHLKKGSNLMRRMGGRAT